MTSWLDSAPIRFFRGRRTHEHQARVLTEEYQSMGEGVRMFGSSPGITPSSLLKILFSLTADSVFCVYRLGAEVIWIACDAINWPFRNRWSCSGHQVSQSAEIV